MSAPGTLGVAALALASAGAALVLAVLVREHFRGSPFGEVMSLLPLVLGLFVLAPTLHLVVPEARLVIALVEAAAFALLLLFAVSLVRLHARLAPSTPEDRPGEVGR